MNKAPRCKSTKSNLPRHFQWLAEIESGKATVRRIAIREFVTPVPIAKVLPMKFSIRDLVTVIVANSCDAGIFIRSGQGD